MPIVAIRNGYDFLFNGMAVLKLLLAHRYEVPEELLLSPQCQGQHPGPHLDIFGQRYLKIHISVNSRWICLILIIVQSFTKNQLHPHRWP